MAQQLVEKKGFQNHQLARTSRMALYGGGLLLELIINSNHIVTNWFVAAMFGPAATNWFKFLQTKIVLKNKNLEIVARVAADQTLFAPTNLFIFLSSMAIMEGSSPSEKLEKTYTTALTKNWMVWPFVQLINFRFIPLEHRVLLVNVISLGWNCYLSYINSSWVHSYISSILRY